ncbi:hypothetical protein EJ110_NYTH11655 [Nymphaea thermarum]|nr:hypothetical protein EJ110_NYTH11655 [Nymphaea thermarum]
MGIRHISLENTFSGGKTGLVLNTSTDSKAKASIPLRKQPSAADHTATADKLESWKSPPTPDEEEWRPLSREQEGHDLELGSLLLYVHLQSKLRRFDGIRRLSMPIGHQLFDDVPGEIVVCSTTMISGNMKCGRAEDVEEIFNTVIERDVVVGNWGCNH